MQEFPLDVEKAYEQIWQVYNSHSGKPSEKHFLDHFIKNRVILSQYNSGLVHTVPYIPNGSSDPGEITFRDERAYRILHHYETATAARHVFLFPSASDFHKLHSLHPMAIITPNHDVLDNFRELGKVVKGEFSQIVDAKFYPEHSDSYEIRLYALQNTE